MDLPELQNRIRIYDLLKNAGMVLKDWPHANDPSRNQRWAWLERDIAVVNVWTHKISPPKAELDSYSTFYIARGQGSKGDKMDEIYQEIIRRNLRVHVLLKEKSTGKRALDTKLWSATYDSKSGTLYLVRGEENQFEDQHGNVNFPKKTGDSISASRNWNLRLQALKRSSGRCEYCNKPGFRTAKGAIFAEVHHITPLKEKGSDSLENLIVLCPDDHRKAHHSTDIEKMKAEFELIRSQSHISN